MFDAKTIGNNMYRRRTEKNMTQKDIADRVKITLSTISRYESGKILSPKIPVLDSIAKALDMSPLELYGEGVQSNVFPANLSDSIPIPVIGRAAAGLSCHAEQNIESYEYVSKDIISASETYVYIRVIGDSMSPLIMEGDLVLVRCQDTIESGEYAVVLIDNEDGVVKKVIKEKGAVKLISENPYYPPRVFEGRGAERLRIFGKVIESKRKF